MTQPKVSICIPTYNRASFLEELFKSIYSQLETVEPGKVEIAVSDNASTDATAEVLSRWEKKIPLRVNRNSTNIGPDRNYFAAVATGTGEYSWLMGSDDELAPDGLRVVLKHLEEVDSGDIHLYERYNCNFKMRPYSKSKWTTCLDGVLVGPGGISPERYVQSCLGHGGVFSYLSTIVVRRNLMLQVSMPEKIWSSAYSHAYALLRILCEGNKLKKYDFPVVRCRHGNDFFMHSGYAKRVLIEFEGYEIIASELSLFPGVSSAILDLIRHVHSRMALARAFGHAQLGGRDVVLQLRSAMRRCGHKEELIDKLERLGRRRWLLDLGHLAKGWLRRSLGYVMVKRHIYKNRTSPSRESHSGGHVSRARF